MTKYSYPCTGCTRPDCDYRRCQPYRDWFCASWNQFHRNLSHHYWCDGAEPEEKLSYVHPDVLRRYLHSGPCGRCVCSGDCDDPCRAYWQWWDARMAWLKWRLQQELL